MKLNELLAVCREQADTEMQVVINGEGIIGNPAMLEVYLCKDALNMYVVEFTAVGEGSLKVWVEA